MKLRIPDWSAPLAFLLVCGVSYGLLMPYLGFYQDDWHHIYYAATRGLEGLKELFLYDSRPNAAYITAFWFYILGFKPLAWHVTVFILRWACVVLFWLVWRMLWSEAHRQALWAGLLLCVYPLFKLQPLAVAYAIHWTCYFLYALSLFLMVWALRGRRKWLWPLYSLSIVLCATQVFSIEYFVGLELLRPLILWLLLSKIDENKGKRLLRTVAYEVPYLVVLIAFVIWRAYILRIPAVDNSNAPVMLYSLVSTPLTTIIKLIQMALQDFIAITFSVWQNILNPGVLDTSQPFDRWALLCILGCTLFTWLYLLFVDGEQENEGNSWKKQALLVGLLATLLGPLPGWMIGEQISTQNPLWSDRFGLAAMIGASLFILALMEWLIHSRKTRALVLALMIGLSVGWHLRIQNDYRWEWSKQVNFYHQLLWRAPAIQPNTSLMADNELFQYMGYYPTSFAINSLYAGQHGENIPYWFWGLYKYFSQNDEMKQLKDGEILRTSKFSSRFSASGKDTLILNYKPETSRCLWLVRSQDTTVPVLPYITRDAAQISNLERIQSDIKQKENYPVNDIIGQEPDHDWCYTFQKADLARQNGDWDKVLELWKDAAISGLKPGHAYELLPFLDAFIAKNRWKDGLDMTLKIQKMSDAFRPTLCARWWEVNKSAPPSQERDDVLTQVEKNLECGKLK